MRFLISQLARGRSRNFWISEGAITGREAAHQRRTGDAKVCESLESLLTDSKPLWDLREPHCVETKKSAFGAEWSGIRTRLKT